MRWPWRRKPPPPKKEDVLVVLERLQFDADRFMEAVGRRITEAGGRE